MSVMCSLGEREGVSINVSNGPPLGPEPGIHPGLLFPFHCWGTFVGAQFLTF